MKDETPFRYAHAEIRTQFEYVKRIVWVCISICAYVFNIGLVAGKPI